MYFSKDSKVFEFNLHTLEISELLPSSLFKRLEGSNLVSNLLEQKVIKTKKGFGEQ